MFDPNAFDTYFPQLDDSSWAQASQTDVPPYQQSDGSMPIPHIKESQTQQSYGSHLLLPALRIPYAEATTERDISCLYDRNSLDYSDQQFLELDDPTFWRQIASQVDVTSLLHPDTPYWQPTPEHLWLPAPSMTTIIPYRPGTTGQSTQATKQSMLLPIIMIVLSAMMILAVFSTTTTGNKPGNTTNTFNDTTPEVSGTWNVHCHQGTPSGIGGTYSIVGPATIDADFINQVLAHYNSPMIGQGQLFENISRYCGLDPAFVLAFYMHESSFGLSGEARESLSPGNLRCIPGVKCQDGYAWFDSWQDGLMVQCRLLRNLYVDGWGLSTPDLIIPKYAPAADHNNEAAYEYALKHAVDTWRQHVIVVS